MLVSLPVQTQMEKEAPFSDKLQTPPPTPLLSDMSSLKAKGPSPPLPLRSRQHTQNPLPWEQPGGSGWGGRLLCLLCQWAWSLGLSPSGRRSTRSPCTSDTPGNELWPGAEYIHRMTSSCLLPLNTSGPHRRTGRSFNSPFHSLSPFHFPK